MSAVTERLSTFSAAQTLQTYEKLEYETRRTKIVCTLGPACTNVDTLVKMIDAGMDIARLNLSHGDHLTHKETVNQLNKALTMRPKKKVGLMLDTKGPEIRTGELVDGKPVLLTAGQDITITTDYQIKGTSEIISCSYKKLPQSVKIDSKILIADGSITVVVTNIFETHITARVVNSAVLGEKKNMNLPGIKVELPVCGDRELNDILNFGLPNNCVFIALSFTQCADDVLNLRKVLESHSAQHMKIIPKIENVEGILNFDEILEVSDGIMVARGDMGMEIPSEKVFIAQKMMIKKCRLAGKCVITATQMLESMIKNPKATRAEISDVANAVIDGSDCVMLSGESANGLYPVLAVETLAKTSFEAERVVNWFDIFQSLTHEIPKPLSLLESLCASAAHIAMTSDVSIILVYSEDGTAARLISKYRPNKIVLGLSSNDYTLQYLKSYHGIVPIKVASTHDNIPNSVTAILSEGREMGFIESKQTALILVEYTCMLQFVTVP